MDIGIDMDEFSFGVTRCTFEYPLKNYEMKEKAIDKEFQETEAELEVLSRTNPDLAARKIISSKRLRELFGVQMTPFVRPEAKIGRNELCPCGSGLKYKKCCGKNE